MALTQLELAGATGLVGFAMFNVFNAYTTAAPKLSDLRSVTIDDLTKRQELMDADFCVGGLALLAGASVSYLSRSWLPLVLVGLGFATLSWYHHQVLVAPTPEQIEGSM